MKSIEDTLYESYGLTERQAHSVARFIEQKLREARNSSNKDKPDLSDIGLVGLEAL